MSVKNNGDKSLPIEEDDLKLLDVMTEGRLSSWTYVKEEYRGRSDYFLPPDEQLKMNTTVNFPEQGESKKVGSIAAR